MSERLVPEAEVHEFLGVKRPHRVQVPSTNLSLLNALGIKWLHRGDILRYLEVEASNLDSDDLRRVRRRLMEATEG